MKIVKVDDLKGTDRSVRLASGGVSNRILLKRDGMGYTLTKTEIPKCDWQHWHYKYHLETCYCILGSGKIHDLKSNKIFSIYPGVVYVLDKHDDHLFKVDNDIVLICVFTPPLEGNEVHQEDGSYVANIPEHENRIHERLIKKERNKLPYFMQR
jgi:L-ectoine synthase